VDFATLIGLISGIGIVGAAIASGSSLTIFFNLPSILIVLGGTIAATLMKFSLTHCLNAVKVAYRAFRQESEKTHQLIVQINHIAQIVRKKGILAAEDEPVKSEFFKKGLQMCVDGLQTDFVLQALREDLKQSLERHDQGQQIFRAIGDAAPAFGMIGTLVGLVQMLSNMGDPSSIGPAMAVALLTTLYGAMIANLVAIPIADKLSLRRDEEKLSKNLIIDGIACIQLKQNPKTMDELLEAYVPRRQREKIFCRLDEKQVGSAKPAKSS
jgi:chemotaxis protein MotA